MSCECDECYMTLRGIAFIQSKADYSLDRAIISNPN